MRVGFFEQDEDSHWYFIPSELLPEFKRLKGLMEGKDYMDAPNVFNDFSGKFGRYMSGGGINHIEVQRGSIKRDPKVEKPPTNKDLLFTFKDGKSHIGMIPEYPDEELVYNSVYYGGYWTNRYEDVEWWCFIEEIF